MCQKHFFVYDLGKPLRSSGSRLVMVPKWTRTKSLADSAFSSCAPSFWHSVNISEVDEIFYMSSKPFGSLYDKKNNNKLYLYSYCLDNVKCFTKRNKTRQMKAEEHEQRGSEDNRRNTIKLIVIKTIKMHISI